MSQDRAPVPQLLGRARLRLAGLSLLVMGTLLYGTGFCMGQLLLQSQEAAIKRELETLAGTLHDSLKTALPHDSRPTISLAAVLPGLCLVGESCGPPADLIHRHAISATDSNRFQLRVLDQGGSLIAWSPGAPQHDQRAKQLGWSLSSDRSIGRWGTHTIHLHHAHGPAAPTWGYLQISRNMADLDAGAARLWWLGHAVFLVAMLVMAGASWWLAGHAMEPLLKAYRRQEQFSSDVAHELRTPLANLLAVVEAEHGTLTQTNQPATASLNRVLAQGQRLQRLIADLLLLASLEQSACLEIQESYRIAECLEDLIEDFSETAQARRVTLELQVHNPDQMVRGQKRELDRLLANLLNNAIHHSPAGGVVRVKLDEQGSKLRIAVNDQGPGIAASEQERIFERFYRSDASRSRKTGGTGLGLAIARAIAGRHQGWLTVQSAPGAGSTFLLIIPSL